MSVYRPNIKYLKEQLSSIDKQSYKPIELLVYDDCPECRTSATVFEESLPKTPFKILDYETKNIGYTNAFEKLIEASSADILFLCDQDDVWINNKVQKCIDRLRQDKSLAVVTDRAIIDENGEVRAPSVRLTSKSKNELWSTGDDIAKYNLFVPYALGMSICIRGEFARSTLPISHHTGHDKWLISCAAAEGIVSYLEEPLVQYRRHGNNVSGVLKGIENKDDYYHSRPLNHFRLIQDFLDRYPNFPDKREILAFSQARMDKDIVALFEYRNLAPEIAWFEIALRLAPSPLFALMVKLARTIKHDR